MSKSTKTQEAKKAKQIPAKGYYKVSHRYGNGDHYDGEWLDGKWHGFGTMKYRGGCDVGYSSTITGQWNHGAMVKGTKTYSNGNTYDGHFKDNKRHGHGIMTSKATGKSWEGEWYDGEKVEGTEVRGSEKTEKAPEKTPAPTKKAHAKKAESHKNQEEADASKSPQGWTCGECTLDNEPHASVCAACEAPRSIHVVAARYGWADDLWAKPCSRDNGCKDVTDIVRGLQKGGELHINPQRYPQWMNRTFWPETAGGPPIPRHVSVKYRLSGGAEQVKTSAQVPNETADLLISVAPSQGAVFVSPPPAVSSPPKKEVSGKIEFLGLWKDSEDRAMPIMMGVKPTDDKQIKRAMKALLSEMRKYGSPCGIIAAQSYNQMHYSADPNETGYQKHGYIGSQPDQATRSSWSKRTHQNEGLRFDGLDGVMDVLGGDWQNAVYRVTLGAAPRPEAPESRGKIAPPPTVGSAGGDALPALKSPLTAGGGVPSPSDSSAKMSAPLPATPWSPPPVATGTETSPLSPGGGSPQLVSPPPAPARHSPAPARLSPVTPTATVAVELQCVICQDAAKNIFFRPCGHVCCCQGCGDLVKECPICRKDITERIIAFV